MLTSSLQQEIRSAEDGIAALKIDECRQPSFNAASYYKDVAHEKYFRCLIALRHIIKRASDDHFSLEQKAQNIDLFMLTPSISSPMGPGSDSEAIPIKFGKLHTYLVDSAQFGFEPLLMNGIDKVYCYLPSMRGEDPDKRHLNQFYHCEYEGIGNLEHVMQIVESHSKELGSALLLMPRTIERLSLDPKTTNRALKDLTTKAFPRITFDEAVRILVENGHGEFINYTKHGRDIRAQGEIVLLQLMGSDTPVWITHYDRDRVPFYQKPDPQNTDKALNADLVFPTLTSSSFGGEIVGCGQRQDSFEEMLESMRRQNVNPEPYQWYADLRRMPNYRQTSGFGIGIERFISWSMCFENIRDAILYPRLKNILTVP